MCTYILKNQCGSPLLPGPLCSTIPEGLTFESTRMTPRGADRGGSLEGEPQCQMTGMRDTGRVQEHSARLGRGADPKPSQDHGREKGVGASWTPALVQRGSRSSQQQPVACKRGPQMACLSDSSREARHHVRPYTLLVFKYWHLSHIVQCQEQADPDRGASWSPCSWPEPPTEALLISLPPSPGVAERP